ncbi:hypothetical protein [Paenibacillus xylanexedens]|uniref:hypothetical protein n=1 Tax=Paenibacillus xylanexedens TaxID=528191 RepID=UPI000F51F897|nr:hypothetical protein [Paenibacillus xylanexedens]
MQQVMEILGVSKRAGTFLNMVEFMFKGNMDYFVDNCKDKSTEFIHSFLYGYRKEMIKMTRFDSYENFNDTYIKDRKSSLERLFQECLSEYQLERFQCNDTRVIYELHVAEPEIRFDRFAMKFM